MIDAAEVHEALMDCLFKEGEDLADYTHVEVVMRSLALHPQRLEEHREQVMEWLQELPVTFNEDSGGGWSFLEACMTRDGTQWGEHSNIDELLVLSIGLDLVKFLAPRHLWPVLPGGMPYFVIKKGVAA